MSREGDEDQQEVNRRGDSLVLHQVPIIFFSLNCIDIWSDQYILRTPPSYFVKLQLILDAVPFHITVQYR